MKFINTKFLTKADPVTSIAIGAGIAFLAPAVIGIVGGLIRPITKAAIKGGMIAYDRTVGAIEGTRESLGDLVTEARTELTQK